MMLKEEVFNIQFFKKDVIININNAINIIVIDIIIKELFAPI